MGASWESKTKLSSYLFLKNPRKISISQLLLVVAPARAQSGERKKKERRCRRRRQFYERYNLACGVQSEKLEERKKERERRQWTIVKSRPSMSMRITPSPGSPNFPCWKTMRAPAALAAAATWQNGGSKVRCSGAPRITYVLFWSPHPIRKVHEHCMNGPVILFLYSTVN